MKDHPDKWVRIHTGIPVPNAANLHDGRVYRVRHQMLFEDGVNSTRFKIWEDGQSEPAFWNSEVNDATVTKTNRFDTGIFSLFHSRATTEWFDIHVRSLDGPQMTLTVEAENGTVARLPSSESYPQGTMVTLSAVADNGHLFSHWTGDLTGSENPATLLMDAEKTVQAVFVPSPPPFEQWRMDNGVAEDTVVIHNQTYPAEHLFIMGAHRTSPDGPWQGLLRIESIIPEANGAHALNFQEQAGRRYRVWWTNDLRGIPEWHDMEHTEPEGPTLFFRLSVEHED
jgi:hypothetical protein